VVGPAFDCSARTAAIFGFATELKRRIESTEIVLVFAVATYWFQSRDWMNIELGVAIGTNKSIYVLSDRVEQARTSSQLRTLQIFDVNSLMDMEYTSRRIRGPRRTEIQVTN
jgi:hypothetical protein